MKNLCYALGIILLLLALIVLSTLIAANIVNVEIVGMKAPRHMGLSNCFNP